MTFGRFSRLVPPSSKYSFQHASRRRLLHDSTHEFVEQGYCEGHIAILYSFILVFKRMSFYEVAAV
jgi:hypothetical protein